MAGLDWLVTDATSGDVLVLTLSAHGTRTIEPDGKPGPAGEAGGNEKIFLTYDCSKSDYLLRDDVWAALDRLPSGVNCYSVIDTCDVGPFYYAKRLDAPVQDQSAGRSDPDACYRHDADTDRRTGDSSPDDVADRVELAACADHEQSLDMPENMGHQGLFTHTLHHTLHRHGWEMTVDSLYKEVRSTVIALAYRMKVKQTPQLFAPRRLMNTRIFR